MRVLARRTAQAASWDGILRDFEERLLSLRNAGAIAAPAYAS